MKQKYFIFAMAGTGKTYTAKHYKNAIELEVVDFKWIYENNDLPYEKKKLYPYRTRRSDYPRNLIDAIFEAYKTHNIVMITLLYEEVATLIDELAEKQDIQIILAYPNAKCYEEYKKRWISRGNSNYFLKIMEDAFYVPIRFFQHLTEYRHIILDSGEFLDGALKRNGIELT